MRRLYWFILAIAVIGVAYFTSIAVSQYSGKDTIRGITQESFLKAVDTTLSPTNNTFSMSNVSIKSIAYIDDSTALVSLLIKQDKHVVYTIFELKDSRLYLTNYKDSPFTTNDFATDSNTSRQVIAFMNSM